MLRTFRGSLILPPTRTGPFGGSGFGGGGGGGGGAAGFTKNAFTAPSAGSGRSLPLKRIGMRMMADSTATWIPIDTGSDIARFFVRRPANPDSRRLSKSRRAISLASLSRGVATPCPDLPLWNCEIHATAGGGPRRPKPLWLHVL